MTTETTSRLITPAELRKAFDGCNPMHRAALLAGNVPIYADMAGTIRLSVPKDLTGYGLPTEALATPSTSDAVPAAASAGARPDIGAIVLEAIMRGVATESVDAELERVFGATTAREDKSAAPSPVDAKNCDDLIAAATKLGSRVSR